MALTKCNFLNTFPSLILFFNLTSTTFSNFTIPEATIVDIQQAFSQHKLTSKQLVTFYLNQIQSLNPLLRGVLEVNPDALTQAEKADVERSTGKELGALHGIPVLLKDSINTNDKLNTTCGSYALLGSKVGGDAGVVARLRSAGAVILGKATLSEWYGVRSLSAPDGWCAIGGQGLVSFSFYSFAFAFFIFSFYFIKFCFRKMLSTIGKILMPNCSKFWKRGCLFSFRNAYIQQHLLYVNLSC